MSGPDRIDRTAATRTGEGKLWFIIVLAFVSSLGPFSIDMYLPAMPRMTEALTASPAAMQMTISGYLLGVAIGPMFLAPLSDAYGRKPTQSVLLVLFAVTTAGCALADSVEELIALRVLQAVTGGAAMASTRAMLSDLYTGNALSRATSVLMSIFTMAPIVAPLCGAWLLELAGWRSIFWAMAIFALSSLAMLQILPETLPPPRRTPYNPRSVVRGYGEIFSSRAALRYLASSFGFALMFFSMLSFTPFIFIDHFGMSAHGYASIFAATATAAIAANFLNARIVFRVGYDRMLIGATWGLGALAAVMALVAATGIGGPWGVFAVMICLMGVFHLSIANSLAGLMTLMGHRAGAASASMALCRFIGGAIGSVAVGAFGTTHPWPFAVMIGAAAAVAGAALVYLPASASLDEPLTREPRA